MKTPMTASLGPIQGSGHFVSPGIQFVTRVISGLALLAGLSAESKPAQSGSMEPVPAMDSLAPGVIAITSLAPSPSFSFDPPQGCIQSAKEGAAEATSAVLNTPELPWPFSGWEPHEALGILEFGAAPFVAGYAAVTAGHRRLSPDQLADTESDLVQAMRSMAAQKYLRQFIVESATAQERRPVVPLSSLPNAGRGATRVSAVLETRVESLRLQRLGKSDGSYALRIQAKARLLRASDGIVLCDRSYQYQSEPAMFIDWARREGFASVAQTGYRFLAGQIAGELIPPAAAPPLRLGAGYHRTPTPWPDVRFARSLNPGWSSAARVRQASLSTADTGAIEIFPKNASRNLFFQKPLTRQEAVDEAVEENGWALDGLQDHRNSVVQAVACVAAVPRGIWEQAVALIRGSSERKLKLETASLNAVALKSKPTLLLAREVAQDLATQTAEPVLLASADLSLEPSAPSDLVLRAGGKARLSRIKEPLVAVSRPVPPPGTTLEIRIVNAELSGKPRINPPMALHLEAKAVLRRAGDNQELYVCPVFYRSKERPFKAWAAGRASLFRQELEQAYSEMGKAIARQLVSQGLVVPSGPSGSTIARN